MITFLFWNLNKKSLEVNIKKLADLYDIDIFIFAECIIQPAIMLKTLNADTPSYFLVPNIGCDKITMFARFSDSFMKTIKETNRLTIRHVALPGLIDILLAAVHLPSKLHWSNKSQSFECLEVSNLIKETEETVGHSRTILVGDLNMNPFEGGFVSANGFNAVMARNIAVQNTRTVQERSYQFFYNPMWNHFGDETPGPPGTYYYDAHEHINYYWNMFDQVLIRSELLTYCPKNFVEILDTDGSTSFLDQKGIPDSKSISDHLPILFRLDI